MVPACFPILTVLVDGLWLGRRSQTNAFLHEIAIASVLFDLFICITATESKPERRPQTDNEDCHSMDVCVHPRAPWILSISLQLHHLLLTELATTNPLHGAPLTPTHAPSLLSHTCSCLPAYTFSRHTVLLLQPPLPRACVPSSIYSFRIPFMAI